MIAVATTIVVSAAHADVFPSEEGTRWTYRTGEGEELEFLVEGHTTVSTGAGPLHFALIRKSDGSDRLILRGERRWVECEAISQSDSRVDCVNPLVFLVLPLREQSSWTSSDYRFTVVGREDVKVPAGSFAKAWKITYGEAWGFHPIGDLWFAEGVGRVRIAEGEGRFELTDFRSSSGPKLSLTQESALTAFLRESPSAPPEKSRSVGTWIDRAHYFVKTPALIFPALALIILVVLGAGLYRTARCQENEYPTPEGLTPEEQAEILKSTSLSGEELSAADERISRLLEEHPGFADLHYQHACIRRAMGDLEGARTSAEAALRLNPTYAQANLLLGGILIDAGDPAKAARCFEVVLSDHWDYADAHLGLGRARLAEDSEDAAKAALERALEINPGLDEARRLLRRVRK